MSRNPFTDHPESVGETYIEHMGMALGFSGRLFVAAAVCLAHAFLPLLFERTGSRMIADLYQRTGPGRIKAANATKIPGKIPGAAVEA